MNINILKNKIGGFTLVEMLVSLAVFVIVTAIVGGIYTTFVQKQRDQLGMQNVQQDVQNFFDTLEREIRTGYGDTFVVNNTATSSSLVFNNQEKDSVEYGWDNTENKVKRGGASITSDRTYIQQLNFIVPSISVAAGDATYSYLTGPSTRVTVLVKACVDKADNNCLSTQTSLSIRQFKPMP